VAIDADDAATVKPLPFAATDKRCFAVER
jgi:hypothetical protein